MDKRIEFIDKNGTRWDMVHIQELIDGYIGFSKFMEIMEYYSCNLKNMRKMRPVIKAGRKNGKRPAGENI